MFHNFYGEVWEVFHYFPFSAGVGEVIYFFNFKIREVFNNLNFDIREVFNEFDFSVQLFAVKSTIGSDFTGRGKRGDEGEKKKKGNG